MPLRARARRPQLPQAWAAPVKSSYSSSARPLSSVNWGGRWQRQRSRIGLAWRSMLDAVVKQDQIPAHQGSARGSHAWPVWLQRHRLARSRQTPARHGALPSPSTWLSRSVSWLRLGPPRSPPAARRRWHRPRSGAHSSRHCRQSRWPATACHRQRLQAGREAR